MIIHDIEQGTNEWYSLRAGMPTASEFSFLVNNKGLRSESFNDYARILAASVYTGHAIDAWEGNKETERGHILEPLAAVSYELETGSPTEKVGFVTDDKERYGCSPDRFVGNGMVEIKCRIAKHHIAVLQYYRKHKKPPPQYLQQAYGQLLVTKKDWNDLYFYHPELPCLRIRIYQDIKYFENLEVQINAVIEKRDEIVKMLREY